MPARHYLDSNQIVNTIGDICIKFVDDHRRLQKYHIVGSNNFESVLMNIHVGILSERLDITYENSMYIEVEVQPEINIYVFLTETDANTLLLTISTNKHIIP